MLLVGPSDDGETDLTPQLSLLGVASYLFHRQRLTTRASTSSAAMDPPLAHQRQLIYCPLIASIPLLKERKAGKTAPLTHFKPKGQRLCPVFCCVCV